MIGSGAGTGEAPRKEEGARDHAPGQAGHRGNPIARRVRRLARWVHDRTWRKVYWPDATCFWIVPAYRRARKLHARESFDALVTVSHPFSAHMVGRLMKRRFPGLCWVADNGDPFSFLEESQPNNFSLYRGLNERADLGVIRRSDHFVVTNDNAADLYTKMAPECGSKIAVLPPAIPDPFLTAPGTDVEEIPFAPGKIIATYVGGWHKGIREPDEVLRLLEMLARSHPSLADELEWHVFGPTHLIAPVLSRHPSVAHRVFLHGVVSRDTAFRALRQSHLLINVGNRTAFQLPSKLVEYIASGRPILNVRTREDDSSSAFLAEHGNTLDVNVRSEAEVLNAAAFVRRSRTMADARDRAGLARYSVVEIARAYLALMRPPGVPARTGSAGRGEAPK